MSICVTLFAFLEGDCNLTLQKLLCLQAVKDSGTEYALHIVLSILLCCLEQISIVNTNELQPSSVVRLIALHLNDSHMFSREEKMAQKTNKLQDQHDTKKLSVVVVFLSIFVIALFGLAPIV